VSDTRRITVNVNGKPRTANVETRVHLADFLRQSLSLIGTHLGCEHGVCGACTIIVSGSAVRSCLMLAVQADGADIETVESLGTTDALSPLQRAFSRHHALQWVLYIRHADVARGLLARPSQSKCCRNPRSDFGQHLPLHGLSGDRGSRARRGG
jgi:hypothetical protein